MRRRCPSLHRVAGGGVATKRPSSPQTAAATVYRASGSHAGSLRQAGIDLAGDNWDGSLPQQPPRLMPADQARRGAPAFDPGATPPWSKEVWSDPESVTTGPPGSRATYARYARWWSDLCLLC